MKRVVCRCKAGKKYVRILSKHHYSTNLFITRVARAQGKIWASFRMQRSLQVGSTKHVKKSHYHLNANIYVYLIHRHPENQSYLYWGKRGMQRAMRIYRNLNFHLWYQSKTWRTECTTLFPEMHWKSSRAEGNSWSKHPTVNNFFKYWKYNWREASSAYLHQFI